ncbi:unnamed protein product, partial [Closterium sp. Naga37s-1]
VPHVRQQHSWDCGVACVLMVLKALQVPIHPVQTEPTQSIPIVHSLQPIRASPAMPAATAATRSSGSSVVFPVAHSATAVIHNPATAASPALVARATDTDSDPATAAATAFASPPPSSAATGAATNRFPAAVAQPAISPLTADSFALEAPHEELSLHGSAQMVQGDETGAQVEAVRESAAVARSCLTDRASVRVAEGAHATWESLEPVEGAVGCGDVGEGANGCMHTGHGAADECTWMRTAVGAGVAAEGLVRRGSARGRGCAVRGGEGGCDAVHDTTQDMRAVACASAGVGRGRAGGSREACELQHLHRQCGTTSVWSIDLVALLQRHGVGVEFLTVTIGANPSFASQPFYKENMPGDVVRVNRLFADTIRAGVRIQCASIGIQHLAWLLLSGRYLIIALVDKRSITHPLASERCPPECCGPTPGYIAIDRPARLFIRRAMPVLAGHFVVLCGFDSHSKMFEICDPSSHGGTSWVPMAAVEDARMTFGTDQDLILDLRRGLLEAGRPRVAGLRRLSIGALRLLAALLGLPFPLNLPPAGRPPAAPLAAFTRHATSAARNAASSAFGAKTFPQSTTAGCGRLKEELIDRVLTDSVWKKGDLPARVDGGMKGRRERMMTEGELRAECDVGRKGVERRREAERGREGERRRKGDSGKEGEGREVEGGREWKRRREGKGVERDSRKSGKGRRESAVRETHAGDGSDAVRCGGTEKDKASCGGMDGERADAVRTSDRDGGCARGGGWALCPQQAGQRRKRVKAVAVAAGGGACERAGKYKPGGGGGRGEAVECVVCASPASGEAGGAMAGHAKVGNSDSPVLLMPLLPLLPVLPVLPVAPVLPAVPVSAGRSTAGGRRRLSAAEFFGSGVDKSRACGRGAGACERARGEEELECGASSTACEGALPAVCSAIDSRGLSQGIEAGQWRDGGDNRDEAVCQTKGKGGTGGGGERGKATVVWDGCAVATVHHASASTAAIPAPAVARIPSPPAVSPPEATSSLHQPCFLISSHMECAASTAAMGGTGKAGRAVPGLAREGTESSRARGGCTQGTRAELHPWQCAGSRSERHVASRSERCVESRSRSVTPEPSAGDLDLCVDRCLAMIGGAEDSGDGAASHEEASMQGGGRWGLFGAVGIPQAVCVRELGSVQGTFRLAAEGSFPAAAAAAAGGAAGGAGGGGGCGGGGGALFGDVGRVAFARHKEVLRAAGRRGHWQE